MLDTLRVAALRVAAMNPKDQDWILAQLSTEETDRLMPLIAEIQNLGLENIDDVYQASLEQHQAELKTQVEQNQQAMNRFERWSTADFDSIKEELEVLPETLRLAVLSSHPWPWLTQALEYFSLKEHVQQEQIRSNDMIVKTLLDRCQGKLD